MNICRVADCTSPVQVRDWCNRHYLALYRKGEIQVHHAPELTEDQLAVPHRITERNLEEKTGVCSVCGPTFVRVRQRRDRPNPEVSCQTKDYAARSARRRTMNGGTLRRNVDGPRRGGVRMPMNEYMVKVEHQHGMCAICGKYFGDALVIDHCHESGKFRDLLCFHCNVAIGHMRDDPQTALAAAMYLERHHGF